MLVKNIYKQHTVEKPVKIHGKGLHTDEYTSVNIVPAKPNTGIEFVRVDLPSKPVIKADCDLVIATERCTKLGVGNVSISTVEHLLAALKGCFIDNAMIEITGGEVPILDGSSQPFVEELLKAGITEQDAKKIWWDIDETIICRDEEKESELILVPSEDYYISTLISFPNKSIALQHATLESINFFVKEIAPARTFCFYSEIEELLNSGIIKGGNENNALIILDKPLISGERQKIQLGYHKNDSYVTQTEVRFSNEPARHKLLDIVGDLSLCGYSFKGKIISSKPGHKTNIQLAQKIKRFIESKEQKVDNSSYLLNENPVYNIHDTLKLLPHRYPFVLVDKVVEITDQEIVAIKNVTFNEPFFQGHFPGNPIMPGVMVVEAMAQAGGIFTLCKKENPEDYDTVFLKIERCRFKQKIHPGDTMIIKMQSLFSNERGINEMKGQVFVHNNLCCEALLLAQVIDKKHRKY